MKWPTKENVELVEKKGATLAIIALISAVIWLALAYKEKCDQLNLTQEKRIEDQKVITSYGITLVELYKQFNEIQDKEIYKQYGTRSRTNSSNADSTVYFVPERTTTRQ